MNFLEPCGLVKMDFLGLKNLDVIAHTENLIRQKGAQYANFNIKEVPDGDKKTYEMLGEGNSFGVFQFESPGMQNILKQTKPASIEDLTALNAMYRPGPMQNIPRFVESKNGRQEITYPDKSLEGVLKETYGVIVYQEQVMEVAKIIAGYSMGQADLLRRAMGKKKREIIEKEKITFLEGAAKQGYSKAKAGAIYDMLEPFAEYGFNKSHAAAYSVLAYQTAYLKANFTAEFMAANLTNEITGGKIDKVTRCIAETRRMGIEVEPPDINKSDKLITVVNGHVVFGFLGIKGVGEASSDEIVKGRKDGPYKSFMDFLEKVDIKTVGKKVIELLIQTGAFDSFGISRETLAGNLERVVEYALKKKEDALKGQTSLFEDSGEAEFADYEFEKFPETGREDRLNLEKKLIGFYFSGHPMDEYREIWEKAVKIKLGSPDTYKIGNCILIGIVKNINPKTTNRGTKIAFATLEDFNGEIETAFFDKSWLKLETAVKEDKVAILQGKIDYQKDKDRYTFIVEDIVGRQEVDKAIKENEEQSLKWEAHRNTWMYMADLKSGSIEKAQKGNYTVIGYLKKLREWKDKNQNDMAFATLRDFEGDIELVFFAKTYADCRALLNLDEIIALKGSIDPAEKRPEKPLSFRVSSIADFAQLTRAASRKQQAGEKPPEPLFEEPKKQEKEQKKQEIHIRLKSESQYDNESFNSLCDYFADHSGAVPMYLHVPDPGGEKTILAKYGINIAGNGNVAEELKNNRCVAEVWEV
jgi:DNA polymerase-3 subunit alpha